MSGIKTGDTVKIISGSNKGKSGKVVKVDRRNGRAMVEGIGVRERHIRASYLNPKGSKKEIHVGIDLSNLKKEEGKK
ncbi:KOW motif-containing protein [Candidatus Saccharibacteria bacterium]|nr:KOW motif-containing protein [Candidatus Saccharibacteria bacterium]